MLKIYLVSAIIWLIILIATDKFGKAIIKNKDIDYSKYIKNGKSKVSYFVIAFIPVIRLIVWGTMLFLVVADEEMLDKLFKDKSNE